MARVLVVDDTEILRRALVMAVKRMGHTPASAGDGPTALEAALKDPPDVALLDWRMPGMDGGELYRALRQQLGDRCPRVIFVSATPADEIAREVAAIGSVAGFVKKPFCLDDLARAVDEALAPEALPHPPFPAACLAAR